ncbi:hypothetical protein ACIGXI_31865 [Kitasatospora aureofaciens]|uniref:hypothetical protein n=1 Tax=Kitasatospora aureofaciens TaxID=1894 RepID=UPI0037C53A60
MTTRTPRRRTRAQRTRTRHGQALAARVERPAWRDPSRMLGAVLANAGAAALWALAQHIEITWR